MRTIGVASGLAMFLLLTACAAEPSGSDPESEAPDPGAVDPAPPPTAEDCLVGDPWSLNLVDYADQAQSYLMGLGVPVEGLEMNGSQTVQFSSEGQMSVLTDITSTGTIVTPEGPIPFSVYSGEGGSGDWDFIGDTLMITSWSIQSPEQPTAEDPLGLEIPVPDYSTIPEIGVTCQPGLLTLVAPESPFVPLFSR
ncbi:hypothetical protein HDC94_001348 [Leifsonia sp. AK011]|uniref:hypothetical protein n=1 Tax=Leifsonia sp. AK011 TaxID=2723075 RepID=UPI0015CC85F9|nr:hypothetical protein [Leifsonia sp. AK011]NYF10192.1 hypothetical protein [Leifsonia sp. AK011]